MKVKGHLQGAPSQLALYTNKYMLLPLLLNVTVFLARFVNSVVLGPMRNIAPMLVLFNKHIFL